MATVTTYNLKIIQTRPDIDTPWYKLSDAWLNAWADFNKYSVDVEITVDNEKTTVSENRLKIYSLPATTFSEDELISTRTYINIPANAHDEFVALLADNSSKLIEEKNYDEEHGITYQIVSEEIHYEIPTEHPVVAPPEYISTNP